MPRECGLCGGIGIHELDNPAVRWLCDDCSNMMHDHVAFICGSCGSRSWMPKTAENVMFLAESRGIPPEQLMNEPIYFEMSHCKRCLAPARKLNLVHSASWAH